MGNFVIPKTTSSPTVPAGGTFGQILAKTNEFDFNTQWINNTDLNAAIGTGTINYLSKFTGSNTLGNSLLFDNGTKVGIGTTSFVGSIKLAVNGQIGGPTYSATYLDITGAIPELRGNSGIGYYSSVGNHIFYGGSSVEYMRLTTAGLLGIGTNSPIGKLDVVGSLVTARVLTTGSLSLIGTDASALAQTVFTISTGVNNATGPNIILAKARGQANEGLATSDILGTIQFQGGNGSTLVESARIQSVAASGFSVSSRASSLLFYTTAIGSTTITERMRISSEGNVGIGTTTPAYKLDVQGTTVTSGISTDIGLNLNPVINPSTGTAVLSAVAGNIDIGIHYYWVSFVTAVGETGTYNFGNITTVSGSQQATLTIPVSTDYRVTSRKLHRTKANGNSYETYVLTTIANNTATTYTDNIADASLTGVVSAGYYQINTTNQGISVNASNVMRIDKWATHFGINAGVSVNGGGNNTLFGYRAGQIISTGNQNVGVGNQAGLAWTSATNNVAVGPSAMSAITIGDNNISIGRNSTANINGGSSGNVIIGGFSWNAGTPSAKQGNTGLGTYVGSTNTGNYNLFLGFSAGYYVTGNNNILLDTIQRADEVTSKTSALIYGVTNATPASQILQLGGGGNVGIGTISPTYRLDIPGTTALHAMRSYVGYDIYPVPEITTYATATVVAGGAMGIGNYYYGVTYVTALGETHLVTNGVAVVTTSGNQAVNLSNIPVSSDSRVTSRKIYRSLVNGQYYNIYLVATIANNVTTTYSDTIADASLGTLNAFFRVNTTTNNITVRGAKAMVLDSNNVAFGIGSSFALTSGGRITAIGTDAGRTTTTGGENTYLGFNAGYGVTTGSANTYIGVYTATAAGSTATYNVAVGRSALGKVTSGGVNTSIGTFSGYENTIGYENVFLGYYAGAYLNDGTTPLTSATYGTYIGKTAKGLSATETNAIVIGFNALGLGSNTTVIGNASTLKTVLWGNVGIGATTPTARLQVKGDGTNPIARFETSTSAIAQQFYDTSMIGFGNVNPVYAGIYGHSSIDPNTATASSLGVGLISNQSSTTASYGFGIRTTNGSNAAQWITGTGGLIKFITSGFIPSAAGNGNYRNLEINYSLNGTNGAQTGTATGIFLNATETALNGMTHNLMDLQVGGVSKFKISNTGTTTLTGILYINNQLAFGGGAQAQIVSNSTNNLLFRDAAGTSFGLLQLGGTTNLFPAIGRSSAALTFILADNSGYAQYVGRLINWSTTVKNAASNLAAGLIVYDTTLNKLSFYNGTTWETVTSI